MELSTRLYRLAWNPGILQTVCRFLLLLAHIRDLNRFRRALRADDWGAAAEYTDYSTEADCRARVEALYADTTQLVEALPCFHGEAPQQ